MDYKEAVGTLIKMIDKHPLDDEEKEAVKTAIGVLGWATLAQSKIKVQKEKREKRT